MQYPKAGDLQKTMASKLTGNPTENPWEVRSDSGLEGVFADQDDAEAEAANLRAAGAKGVVINDRRRTMAPMRRPSGAPPMHHIPRGRPSGVPNANPPGKEITVDVRKLWAWGPKVDATIIDVNEGRLSYSNAQPLVVSRLDTPRGAFYIVDGHHRAVEAVVNGRRTVLAIVSDEVPRIERTGGAHRSVVEQKVNVSKHVMKARSNPEEDIFDTDILAGMERAIWVTSYASWVEGLSKAERKEAGTPVNLQGIDWDDAAPAAPPSAEMAAQDMYLAYERANGKSPGQLYEAAVFADKARATDELAEVFGHYLAMQALDHGVSWFDDHAKFPLKAPSFEAHYDDGEIVWSPMIRSRLNGGGRR
jgi:hypothetical protein